MENCAADTNAGARIGARHSVDKGSSAPHCDLERVVRTHIQIANVWHLDATILWSPLSALSGHVRGSAQGVFATWHAVEEPKERRSQGGQDRAQHKDAPISSISGNVGAA
jgi:hypothetical protein